MKKKNQLAQLRRKIEKHMKNIAKERDALRVIESQIQDVLEPSDRAVRALEEALDALSEQI